MSTEHDTTLKDCMETGCVMQVIVDDPFNSGRCEDCFSAFVQLPQNKGLTSSQYNRDELTARVWHGQSNDDKKRKVVS